MKIKFVTAIYNNLHGTELGGRNRATQYNYSLLSLLKMSFADFICYTSEKDIEGLKDFFYNKHNVNPNKLEFRVYELERITNKYNLNEYKNIEEVKQSERCYELQYAKFEWLEVEASLAQFLSDSPKHYIFWIDAGLSHTGLLPNKHLDASKLSSQEWPTARYYESPLFNNTFLHNVVKASEPFFFIVKDNNKEFYVQELDERWYCEKIKTGKSTRNGLISIGGLFGGESKAVEDLSYSVKYLLDHYISREGKLPTEEQVMTIVVGCSFVGDDFSHVQRFDTWWHEDSNIQDVHPIEYFKEYKSFYKVLEGLQ